MWRGTKESTTLGSATLRRIRIQILQRLLRILAIRRGRPPAELHGIRRGADGARIMWLEFSLDVKQDSSSTLAARSLTAASPPPLSQSWRLLLTLPADGAWNMALDEALMEHARRTNEWVLRVYAWSAPTLSFGRNQRALGVYLPERLERDAVSVVRRPTGGRAILHWREITYSVVAPANEAG